MIKNIIFVSSLFFLYSCTPIIKKDFTYHALWNKTDKIFEKDLVQLGYLTPYMNVKSYKDKNDSIYIKAYTNFDFMYITNKKKYLFECNQKGQIIDTLLALTNELEITFKYQHNKNNFFVFIEDGKDRGAYFNDRKFRIQSD